MSAPYQELAGAYLARIDAEIGGGCCAGETISTALAALAGAIAHVELERDGNYGAELPAAAVAELFGGDRRAQERAESGAGADYLDADDMPAALVELAALVERGALRLDALRVSVEREPDGADWQHVEHALAARERAGGANPLRESVRHALSELAAAGELDIDAELSASELDGALAELPAAQLAALAAATGAAYERAAAERRKRYGVEPSESGGAA